LRVILSVSTPSSLLKARMALGRRRKRKIMIRKEPRIVLYPAEGPKNSEKISPIEEARATLVIVSRKVVVLTSLVFSLMSSGA